MRIFKNAPSLLFQSCLMLCSLAKPSLGFAAEFPDFFRPGNDSLWILEGKTNDGKDCSVSFNLKSHDKRGDLNWYQEVQMQQVEATVDGVTVIPMGPDNLSYGILDQGSILNGKRVSVSDTSWNLVVDQPYFSPMRALIGRAGLKSVGCNNLRNNLSAENVAAEEQKARLVPELTNSNGEVRSFEHENGPSDYNALSH